MAQALKDFHTQIMALVALIVLVAGFVLAPADRLEHVGNALVVFGSTGYGASIYSALGALVLAIIKAAFDRVPKTATTTVTVTTPVKVESSKSGHATPAAMWLALSIGCAVVLIAGHLHGCGGPAVTAQQRVDYSAEAARCLANEQAIVDRPATSEAHDLADLDAEELRCRTALDAIEHPAIDGGV